MILYELIKPSGFPVAVKTDVVSINPHWENTPPKNSKMRKKREYYKMHGTYESQIVLDYNYNLIDGYTSYLIAKEEGNKYIPVIFNDRL